MVFKNFIQELNRRFKKSIKMERKSLTNIGATTCRSMELTSPSFRIILNQNLFYQQD